MRLKQFLSLLIAATLLLSVAACAMSPSESSPAAEPTTEPSPSPSATPEATATPEPTPEPPARLPHLPEYPIIDGSSSTETMHSAIRGHLADIWLSVKHSRTYEALTRLYPDAENPADVVLAVKYYDETLADAAAHGTDLVITPVAKEGFIFLLHTDNPIDALTQQQIRDIYSGKITNWKDLGGLDETIIPFQRNQSSGSQTAMFDFMRDLPFPDAPADAYDVYVADSMSSLLWDIEATGSAAIGYNIFSWSMEQQLDYLRLKPVSVDGIAPTNETIADDTYPLVIYTYSY